MLGRTIQPCIEGATTLRNTVETSRRMNKNPRDPCYICWPLEEQGCSSSQKGMEPRTGDQTSFSRHHNLNYKRFLCTVWIGKIAHTLAQKFARNVTKVNMKHMLQLQSQPCGSENWSYFPFDFQRNYQWKLTAIMEEVLRKILVEEIYELGLNWVQIKV